MSVIFLEGEKQKQIFIPPLSLIHLKFCNCIKIKFLFIYISEKSYSNRSFKIFNIKYEKPLCLLFILCLHFPINFCRRSLKIKKLIKHENKFNRKLFHEKYFFIYHERERLQKVYHEHLSVVYKMNLS